MHARRGDARRLLLSKLVLDHRLAARDPFAPEAGRGEAAIADVLLGMQAVDAKLIADMLRE